VAIFNGILFHAIVFGIGTSISIKLGWPTEVTGLLGIIFTTAVPLRLASCFAPRSDYDKMKDSDEESA